LNPVVKNTSFLLQNHQVSKKYSTFGKIHKPALAGGLNIDHKELERM